MHTCASHLRICVALAAVLLGCAMAPVVLSAGAPTPEDPFADGSLRLLAVVAFGQQPKALISLSGVEGETLVGEGDLVENHTVVAVSNDHIRLARGSVETAIYVGSARWIRPDMAAKVYTQAYKGPNTFYAKKSYTQPRQNLLHRRVLAEAPKSPASLKSKRVTGMPRFADPLRGKGEVSSPFGPRRRPRSQQGPRGSSNHKGFDIKAPRHTAVRAAADGVVIRSAHDSAKGNYVGIRHSGGYTTYYMHLNRRYKAARVGSEVSGGQTIGTLGNTGVSTGPHLHFEIRHKDKAMDPVIFIPSLVASRR